MVENLLVEPFVNVSHEWNSRCYHYGLSPQANTICYHHHQSISNLCFTHIHLIILIKLVMSWILALLLLLMCLRLPFIAHETCNLVY